LPALPTSCAVAAVATASDGRIYVSGGFDGTYSTNTVEVYSLATTGWSTVAGLANPRQNHAAVEANGLVYMFGGSNNDGPPFPPYIGAVEAYDSTTTIWATKTTGPALTGMGAAVGSDRLVYLLGGADASEFTANAEVYSPITNTIEALQPMLTA
jgi:N-acetylneuraminic acid mutarotase